jgi:hypothetical protein
MSDENVIDASESNYEIAKRITEIAQKQEKPDQVMISIINTMLDHEWVDDELRIAFIKLIGDILEVNVINLPDEEENAEVEE